MSKKSIQDLVIRSTPSQYHNIKLQNITDIK